MLRHRLRLSLLAAAMLVPEAPLLAQCEELPLSPPPPRHKSSFGDPLAVSSDRLLVTEHGSDEPLMNSGKAHFYGGNPAGQWALEQALFGPLPGDELSLASIGLLPGGPCGIGSNLSSAATITFAP